jgi:AcrR family transcriptional regulator
VTTKTPIGSPRERILETASTLFYQNGYRATGINEIIKKSGVAKATFYAHFPSKERLALAYMEESSRRGIQDVKDGLVPLRGPEAKLVGLLANLEGWIQKDNFRGCGFLNMASEIPDPQNPVRKEGKLHYEALRAIVLDLMQDLKRERGSAWRNRNPQKLTEEYVTIVAGALALAELYHDVHPVRVGVEAIKRLIA